MTAEYLNKSATKRKLADIDLDGYMSSFKLARILFNLARAVLYTVIIRAYIIGRTYDKCLDSHCMTVFTVKLIVCNARLRPLQFKFFSIACYDIYTTLTYYVKLCVGESVACLHVNHNLFEMFYFFNIYHFYSVLKIVHFWNTIVLL